MRGNTANCPAIRDLADASAFRSSESRMRNPSARGHQLRRFLIHFLATFKVEFRALKIKLIHPGVTTRYITVLIPKTFEIKIQ